MAQYSIEDLRTDAERLGLSHQAGPVDERAIERVDLIPVDGLGAAATGTLVIITGDEQPPPFRIDVALRQASARSLAGVVFASDIVLPETAVLLAGRAGVPVFAAPGAKAADLAKAIDRAIAGGASEAMMRGALAVERATAAAASDDSTIEDILGAASAALGIRVELVEDLTVSWAQSDAVCIGEVPIGRVVASAPDAATGVAVPVIASLLSRAAQRSTRDRYASTQSRSDLLIELDPGGVLPRGGVRRAGRAAGAAAAAIARRRVAGADACGRPRCPRTADRATGPGAVRAAARGGS